MPHMPKKTSLKEDWHRADIIAAVRKKGTTLYGLSRSLGYKRTTISNALYTPAPRYERLIAEFLDTTPQVIWPSRYHADGSPRSGRGERGLGRYKTKFNAPDSGCNANFGSAREKRKNGAS